MEMQGKIIVANAVNSSELRRSMAMQGVKSLNLRIMNPLELAELLYTKNGIFVKNNILTVREENTIYAKAALSVDYFKTANYSDVKNLAKAIRTIRSLVVESDSVNTLKKILDDDFKTKNDAIFEVIGKYYATLLSEAYEDKIDKIQYIREAISKCDSINVKCCMLEEFPLSPLEKALVEKAAGNGNIETCTIADLYGVSEPVYNIKSFKKCFGETCEVEDIIADIFKNSKTGNAVVAVANPATYGQLFFDYACQYNIPMTFGTGIPIGNSNPAKLLKEYKFWIGEGMFGRDALWAMLDSPAFDKSVLSDALPEKNDNFHTNTYREILGNLHFNRDKAANDEKVEIFINTIEEEEKLLNKNNEDEVRKFEQRKACIPFLKVMASELSMNIENFIYKYSYIRKNKFLKKDEKTVADTLITTIDRSAHEKIYEELSAVRESACNIRPEDIIDDVLGMKVGSGVSSPNAIHITDMAGALLTVRNDLYVVGLSANNFPGSARENYLVLDADLRCFGSGADYLNSRQIIVNNQKIFDEVIRIYSSLKKQINLSYPGLNISELKNVNASSEMYALFTKQSEGEAKTIAEFNQIVEQVGFFDPEISKSRLLGIQYSDDLTEKNIKIKIEPSKTIRSSAGQSDTKKLVSNPTYKLKEDQKFNGFSPTIINKYFECPKKFLYSYVLGISETEEENLFEVISAAEYGIVAHEILEKLGNDSTMSKDDYMKIAEAEFDRFVNCNPPLITQRIESTKKDFLRMMDTAYAANCHKAEVAEEDIAIKHNCGLMIHGLPDKVEKITVENGQPDKYVVVDFKTGRKIKHIENDVETCFQALLYAYILENTRGVIVDHVEYRYLRTNTTVSCVYSNDTATGADNIKAKLDERIKTFKEGLESGIYPATPSEDACKYCKFGDICGKIGGLEVTKDGE